MESLKQTQLSLRHAEVLKSVQNKGPTEFLTDTEFPPTVEMICPDTKHRYYEKVFKDAVWLRPHQIFKENDYSKIKLFDGIDPNDISQGCLGVCYFLCSLAAIAEFPKRLQEVFNTKASNPQGVYSITFYVDGIPREVIVDDFFPCYKANNQPIFSKPKGKELWVLIAEKAWAKLFGNYISTEKGFMDEALEFLTGAPCSRTLIKEKTADEIWEIISIFDKRNYIIAGSTLTELPKELGLVPGHAYSLISAHQLGSYRVFKLRNPWGRFEWTGDFSDNSTIWTEEYKKLVSFTKADDGMFFMTVEDFKKYFEFFSYSYYQDNFHRKHYPLTQAKNNAHYFAFQIDKPTEAFFYLSQKDKRFCGADYKYSPVTFLLLKEDENGFYKKIANGNRWAPWGNRTVYVDQKRPNTLQPGKYLIKTKLHWTQATVRNFTVVTYSQYPLNLTEVSDPKFTKGIMSGYLGHLGKLNEKKTDFHHDCKFSSGWDKGFMYMYAENEGKHTWTLSIELNTLINVELGKLHRKDQNNIEIVLKPKSWACGFARRLDPKIKTTVDWKFKSAFVLKDSS